MKSQSHRRVGAAADHNPAVAAGEAKIIPAAKQLLNPASERRPKPNRAPHPGRRSAGSARTGEKMDQTRLKHDLDTRTLSGDVRDALLTHVRDMKVGWQFL